MGNSYSDSMLWCTPAETAAAADCPCGGRADDDVTVMPGRVTEMLMLCGGGAPGTPVEIGSLKVCTPVNTGAGPCREHEEHLHSECQLA